MNISYIPDKKYKLPPAQRGAATQKVKTVRQQPALAENIASDIPDGVKRSRAGKVWEATCSPFTTLRTAHPVSAHPLAQERQQTEYNSIDGNQPVLDAGALFARGG